MVLDGKNQIMSRYFVSFYFQEMLRKVCSNILTTLLFLNSTVNTRCVWRENLTDMFNHKASSIFVAHIFRRSKNLVLVPTIVVIVWFANQTFWMPYVELIEWYNIYLQMWWIEKFKLQNFQPPLIIFNRNKK